MKERVRSSDRKNEVFTSLINKQTYKSLKKDSTKIAACTANKQDNSQSKISYFLLNLNT